MQLNSEDKMGLAGFSLELAGKKQAGRSFYVHCDGQAVCSAALP